MADDQPPDAGGPGGHEPKPAGQLGLGRAGEQPLQRAGLGSRRITGRDTGWVAAAPNTMRESTKKSRTPAVGRACDVDDDPVAGPSRQAERLVPGQADLEADQIPVSATVTTWITPGRAYCGWPGRSGQPATVLSGRVGERHQQPRARPLLTPARRGTRIRSGRYSGGQGPAEREDELVVAPVMGGADRGEDRDRRAGRAAAGMASGQAGAARPARTRTRPARSRGTGRSTSSGVLAATAKAAVPGRGLVPGQASPGLDAPGRARPAPGEPVLPLGRAELGPVVADRVRDARLEVPRQLGSSCQHTPSMAARILFSPELPAPSVDELPGQRGGSGPAPRRQARVRPSRHACRRPPILALVTAGSLPSSCSTQRAIQRVVPETVVVVAWMNPSTSPVFASRPANSSPRGARGGGRGCRERPGFAAVGLAAERSIWSAASWMASGATGTVSGRACRTTSASAGPSTRHSTSTRWMLANAAAGCPACRAWRIARSAGSGAAHP